MSLRAVHHEHSSIDTDVLDALGAPLSPGDTVAYMSRTGSNVRIERRTVEDCGLDDGRGRQGVRLNNTGTSKNRPKASPANMVRVPA